MNDLFLIKSYKDDHLKMLIDLWKKCGLVVPWNDPTKDIFRKIKKDHEGILLGWMENKLVASVMAGYEGHRGWINYLAIDPDFRRQGFGQSILKKAEAFLLNLECPKINLQIRVSNQQVIEFYEKQGYIRDEVISMGKRLIPDDV